MSIDYMTLAWRTELQAGPRLVLLALSDSANDSGSCFPSVQTLANKCGLSIRAVRGHLSAMNESGLLERAERSGRSTEYQICLKALRAEVFRCLSKRKDPSEYDRGILRACTPDPEDTPADSAPRQILPTPPANTAGDPSLNLPTPPAESAAITVIEPLLNRNESFVGAGAPKKQTVRASVMPSDFVPDATAENMARDFGLSVDDEFAAFADHHAANGTTFKDWQAAFRTWLRNARKFARRDAGFSRRSSPQGDNKHSGAMAAILEG